MSCVKSFYDNWMLRYLTKCIFLIFNLKFELELSDQISFDWIEFELIWFWSDSNWSELIWSVQNFFELNLNCRSDIFDLIWSDRSDSNQIQSDQFFLGALLSSSVGIWTEHVLGWNSPRPWTRRCNVLGHLGHI